MCHVALGIVEAYWEYRLKPWDMAAGVLVNFYFLFVLVCNCPKINTYIYVCKYIHTYKYAYTCKYIHTYINMHIHTYIYIYMYDLT